MFQNILDFCNYWWFRYLMVTELYMVEKWERITIRKYQCDKFRRCDICSIIYTFRVFQLLGATFIHWQYIRHNTHVNNNGSTNYQAWCLTNSKIKYILVTTQMLAFKNNSINVLSSISKLYICYKRLRTVFFCNLYIQVHMFKNGNRKI